ncbi:RNA 2',3'-cyclic phosphodiesterase [Salisediminibacterium halotolerans]|uniref:RNA 2',3'-cyclic phosphodiesterase n=1 Tax=Salisediminibacterium halotolerans TaxID=517425 RepID=A0A1H9UYV7_9BACI|nr:RNA 2',3'-cyclic phosphodiesterase [Salisediminibacterium haloalkalitolerans]SES14227.1 2'-5' RNA ligase [Salisediminibacterium haloalkalitolerans]
MSTSHTFIAIPLAEKLFDTGVYYQNQLDLRTYCKKLVHPDDFHLTLLFLGGCETALRDRIWQDVRQETAGMEKFSLTIRRLNFFGKPNRPRVLFLEPENNYTLHETAETIRKIAAKQGFSADDRPFRPHMTLAKKWRDAKQDWPAKKRPLPSTIEPVTVTAERISLFKIHPERKQKYEELATIWFKEPERRD